MNDFKNNNPFLFQYFSFWQNQKLYFQLMEKFVSEQIDRDNKSNLKELFDTINNQELTQLKS